MMRRERRSNFSAKHRPRFANQWPDNVKVYKYATFYYNIPCCSRVKKIFTIWPQPAGLMFGETSSAFCKPVSREC